MSWGPGYEMEMIYLFIVKIVHEGQMKTDVVGQKNLGDSGT